MSSKLEVRRHKITVMITFLENLLALGDMLEVGEGLHVLVGVVLPFLAASCAGAGVTLVAVSLITVVGSSEVEAGFGRAATSTFAKAPRWWPCIKPSVLGCRSCTLRIFL